MSGERATEEAYSARLAEYRRQIDELDRQLVALLNERARLAQAIGRLKADGEDRVYHPEREAQVLRNVLAGGPRAQAENKALLAGIRGLPATELGRYTAEVIARLRTSPEGQEGLRAFLEKRPPRWTLPAR